MQVAVLVGGNGDSARVVVPQYKYTSFGGRMSVVEVYAYIYYMHTYIYMHTHTCTHV